MEEKKYYELNEEERKVYRRKLWKKIWKVGKKVLFALFCIALILFMGFALLGGMFEKPSEESAVIISLFKLAA